MGQLLMVAHNTRYKVNPHKIKILKRENITNGNHTKLDVTVSIAMFLLVLMSLLLKVMWAGAREV